MNRRAIAAVSAGVCLMGAAVGAHHSFSSEFDSDKPVVLKGTVIKMEWINPHSFIHLAVKDPDGKVTEWIIEGGAPNAMFRRGFNKNSLPAGEAIVVEGFQAKSGESKANGRLVTFADG